MADGGVRSTLKAMCMVVLAARDQMIDIQNGLMKGPGKWWNLFRKFDYAEENRKLTELHGKMDRIAEDLYEMQSSVDPKDSLATDMHSVLAGYLGALIETLEALERNTAGLANVAESYKNKTYTFADNKRDMDAVNEATEKYVKISSVLEELYHQL